MSEQRIFTGDVRKKIAALRTTAQLFTNQDGTGLIKGKLGVQPHNHASQHDKQEAEQRRNRFYYSSQLHDNMQNL
jgi:hypothetical protein